MNPSQLASLLARQAESVCKHLLPGGKRVGNEWVVGDISGTPGNSLKIVVAGDKTGVGSDFATGDVYGDLLDVWCSALNVGLREAMAQSCSYLGVVNDAEQSRPKKEYKSPSRPKSVKRLNKEGAVYHYLKSRGLTDQALEDFRVSEDSNQWVVFPYLRDGIHVNTKYIHIERDEKGKKRCRQEQEAEPCLFGWNALELRFPTVRHVVITEGEIDAITLQQCGVPALSVPNGGGGGKKQDWIDNDYDRMNRFDTIYLCLDNDSAGKEAEKEIIRRLGSERIRVVQLPFKDANECFQNNIHNFNRYLLSAKALDPIELKPADYFIDSVIDKFYPKPGTHLGNKTPWSHVNQALTFNRKELIIWTGYSGSGKSSILNQVALQNMMDGEKFVICSLEMPAAVTLQRMIRQVCGEYRPSHENIKKAIHWLKDKLWLFDLVGTGKTQRIMEVFKYAVRRYDIRNFVLDSLTKCGIPEESYDEQKAFVEQLCDFNHKYDSTTHLVAHQRKPENESSTPGKFGVRGAAAITDEADTIISVWKYKEKTVEENQYRKKRSEPEVQEEKPDTVLSIHKNRDKGIEGSFNLFYNNDSIQFHETRKPPVCYLHELDQQKTVF